ncbi:MAG: vWA domain-containing protein [Anaerolineae bacterium]
MHTYVCPRANPFLHFLPLYVLIATLIVAAAAPPLVHAASVRQQGPTSTPCFGLDLVILVDHSWSMPKNDKYGGRLAAIAYVIDRLGDNAVYYCPGVQHRLAVVGFGEKTATTPAYKDYIADALIAPTPETVEAWEREREVLKAKYELEILGSTDPIPAFVHTSNILENWRRVPPGDSSSVRRQAVILLTDGAPCKTATGCTSPLEWSGLDRYLEELRDPLRPDGDVLPFRGDTGIYLFVLAFQDSTDPEYNYLKDSRITGLWEEVTKEHGGQFLILNKSEEGFDNTDLSVKLTEALDPLLGSALIRNKCGEPIYVEPYLEALLIHVFKVGAETGRKIEDVKIRIAHDRPDGPQDVYVDGEPVRGNAGAVEDYTKQGPNERYVIRNPVPGTWWVTAEGADLCKHVDVRYQVASFTHYPLAPANNEELPQMPEPPYYDPKNPQHFVYAIRYSKTGTPVSELEEFPLRAGLEITTPGGQKQDHALRRNAEGNWESTEPLTLKEDGTYSWILRVTARSVRPDQETFLVLSDSGSFSVRPVQRFGFEVLEPRPGDETPVNVLAGAQSIPVPVTVTLRIVDSNDSSLPGKVVQEGMFLGPLDHTFGAQILGPQGQGLEEQDLKYDPQRNVFYAVLRSAERLGSQVDAPGSYTVRVQLKGHYDKTKWYPRYKEKEIAFSRGEVKPIAFAVDAGQDEKGVARVPLYCGKFACVGAQIAPVRFRVFIQDPSGSTRLDPATIIRGKPEDTFRALLLTPSKRVITVTLNLQMEPEGRVWAGETGEGVPESGEYLLSVEPIPSEIKPAYQLVSAEAVKLPIIREDRWYARPTTCRMIYGGLAGLAVLFLAFMVWNIRTRPIGVITFRDRKTGLVLHEEVLAKGWRGLWHTYRAKGGGLASLDISKLEARRAQSPEGATRAIALRLFDSNGEAFLDEMGIASGEEFDMDRDTVIRYD